MNRDILFDAPYEPIGADPQPIPPGGKAAPASNLVLDCEAIAREFVAGAWAKKGSGTGASVFETKQRRQ